ncbi:hypothetical protein FB45DRAFT_862204 [Roridomyces roridus]|uniref:Secreted protein n=1 Tax=Roridomyces roridus TaxID=1738132 RepID=A0AAD7FZ55_9AGAR|nr:hypothetical protein FB45DRAFT_862204 [Roridomyces roridus]
MAVASPALAANFVWFSGAACSGSVVATNDNIPANECVGAADGASAKSISYSGVPGSASFFESGGQHDFCTNGATILVSGGSGCATAPPGWGFGELIDGLSEKHHNETTVPSLPLIGNHPADIAGWTS